MIAVVYSGSRFANWKLADKGKIISEFKTLGINPLVNDERFINNLLNKTNQLITHAEKIRKIYFFGAGVTFPEQKHIVNKAFSAFFLNAKIKVDNDLKAAAIACCQDQTGIVGILGSGSNAAYFNGKKLTKNNYSLGYLLADEGSSNWLGRRLLKSYLNGVLPKDLSNRFLEKYDLDRKQILEKVYKQSQPVLFLSSFVDFIIENKAHDYIKDLVVDGFERYLATYIKPLVKIHPEGKIYFAGTVASNFEYLLRETAVKNKMDVSMVIKEPIYNVLHYYINKN